MEQFEKKIKKMKKGNSKTGLFFLVFAIILVVMGLLMTPADKETWANFDGTNSGEYQKAEIYYLIGPFAEYEENGVVVEQLYTALTKDEQYILVGTGKTTDLPVLGEDITEENIDTVEPVTIYGYGTMLESDVEGYLVEFWNQVYDGEIFTTSNYMQYFGFSYLNTEDQGETTNVVCYVFGAIFGVLAIIMLLSNGKANKNSENLLNKLEEDGKLEGIKDEYSNGTIDEYKKIKLDLAQNYVISYSQELVILPFADIVNVYHSNMISGVYQPCMYIALETKNNERYYVAQKQLDAKNPQFDEALEKIRSKVKQGGI